MRVINMQLMAGTHINRACADAKRLAKEQRALVRFSFNGIKLHATPKKAVSAIIWEFYFTNERQIAAYHLTALWRKQEAERQQMITAGQAVIDGLWPALDEALLNLDSLVAWLRWFIGASDIVGVNCDRKALSEKLKAAGYVANAHAREGGFKGKISRQVKGEWIAGQVIHMIDRMGSIHPKLGYFCEQYFEEAS